VEERLRRAERERAAAEARAGAARAQAAAERRARRLAVGLAAAVLLLGLTLRRTGADSVPLLRAAQRRYPADFWLNFELGHALGESKREEEAVGYYRAALAARPGTSAVHNNLGYALHAQGRLDDAIQEYQKAITLDPKRARAHGALGLALLKQGRFAEANAATRRGLDLLPPNDPLRRPVTQQLRKCERWLELGEKLPAIPQGEAKPADTAERLALAQSCQQHKRFYAASARFYAEAFAEHLYPTLVPPATPRAARRGGCLRRTVARPAPPGS
jgi:tetratricopeptide (TPR) repeat protein